jgi:hypothetical protein
MGATDLHHVMMFLGNIWQQIPESYDAAVPEDLIYSGQVKLTDIQWRIHQSMLVN